MTVTGDYQALACGLYDYIELACLHHSHVRVSLDRAVDASTPASLELIGYARSTRTVKGEGEFLLLDLGDETVSIRLDHITTLEALDEQAGFGTVRFR
ncbi:Rho-binding antiterminator [Granulosicoccus sp. 3-233]|uniref:Rho-binding antiterminator n=1 Tax=Granulosicoccus sp. 3-233 TaxID=3417969 RepID=UPI003D336DF2